MRSAYLMPEEFFKALVDSGADLLSTMPTNGIDNARRDQITIGVLANTVDRLSPTRADTADAAAGGTRTVETPANLHMIGISHDMSFDRVTAAVDSACERGGAGLWVVERDGELFYSRHNPMHFGMRAIKAGAEKVGAVVITENSLCGANPHLYQALSRWQRSALVGAYLSLQIAHHPATPITILFGALHLQEIREVTAAFLMLHGIPMPRMELQSMVSAAGAGDAHVPVDQAALLRPEAIRVAQLSLPHASEEFAAIYARARAVRETATSIVPEKAVTAVAASVTASATPSSTIVAGHEAEAVKQADRWSETLLIEWWNCGAIMGVGGKTQMKNILERIQPVLLHFLLAGGTDADLASLNPPSAIGNEGKIQFLTAVLNEFIRQKEAGIVPNMSDISTRLGARRMPPGATAGTASEEEDDAEEPHSHGASGSS